MIVWRNGDLVEADAAVSTDDRGWLIGEGAFETLLVDAGRPAFLTAHLNRLRTGLRTFGIETPVEAGTILDAIAALARENSLNARAVCRITATRAGGPRGLAPSPLARARLVVSLAPVSDPPREMRVIVSSRRRSSGSSLNAFKCAGAYAENTLARIEAAKVDANEAIMLNERGDLACASAANIFLLTPSRLVTPRPDDGAMPGVVRGIVLEEANRLGFAIQEASLSPDRLAGSTLMLTNSIVGTARGMIEGVTNGGGDAAFDSLAAAYDKRLAEEWAAAL